MRNSRTQSGFRSRPLAWLALFLSVSLFTAACSSDKKPPPPPPVPVLAATVTAKTVPVELKVIGNVEAYSTVSIKSRLSGQLVQVNFKEGQDVKQGDLLFVIDPRPYEAALRQVEANLARDKALATKAQADAGRYAELIRKQFVSQQDYDQAKATAESLGATVNADQVAVQNAKLNLSYCYIKAPISGRTGSLIAHQGNMIMDNAYTAMLVINQIQPIYVSFAIPEQNLAAVRQYMATEKVPVSAVIAGQENNPEVGVLSFIDNTVDRATGTILCKATFTNEPKRLWPGLFVNVVVQLSTQPNAILVSSQAVQTSQEGQIVFVVKPDLTVEIRPVEVGRPIDGDVIITKGLKPGERVVTDGQLRLVPGALVSIKTGL
ncbi:MAG: efflux RND transporter periplasmic adaptor subunit [Deltaproteobacteria bacterium]|nr:efflux RND transporter periplasmic adaptor subunit [Deltaproteobacteria bacterium]